MINFIKKLFSKNSSKSNEEIEIPVENRVANLDRLLLSLSKAKVKKIIELDKEGKLTKEILNKSLPFQKLPLTDTEKELLLIDDYSPIEERLFILKELECYKEIILIGTLFIRGSKDSTKLYQKGLEIDEPSFANILYFYCVALLLTKEKELCKSYIDLLQKIVIAYPKPNNPPQDLIDKIGFQAHSSLY